LEHIRQELLYSFNTSITGYDSNSPERGQTPGTSEEIDSLLKKHNIIMTYCDGDSSSPKHARTPETSTGNDAEVVQQGTSRDGDSSSPKRARTPETSIGNDAEGVQQGTSQMFQCDRDSTSSESAHTTEVATVTTAERVMLETSNASTSEDKNNATARLNECRGTVTYDDLTYCYNMIVEQSRDISRLVERNRQLKQFVQSLMSTQKTHIK
jgi:hypothetical protein